MFYNRVNNQPTFEIRALALSDERCHWSPDHQADIPNYAYLEIQVIQYCRLDVFLLCGASVRMGNL
jgi:hypothetical protein